MQITPEYLHNLETELAERLNILRPQLAEQLADAVELGDIPENFPYDEANSKHERNEERITTIQNILSSAQLSHPSGTKIEIGSKVEIQKDTGETRIVILVDSKSEEADSALGKVSDTSPLGQKLLHSKLNHLIEIITPKGTIRYKIVKIS